jgi:outer membrane lipoprotein-sorting protein
MKHAASILLAVLMVCASIVVTHAGTPGALTLEDIFNKANSLRYLSYHTKVTSPANTVKRIKIWIHDENVYVSGFLGGLKRIGKKSYVVYNGKWIESPGLTVNTVIRFLKEAQAAEDTRIIGQETLNNELTTVIEYTQPRPKWGSEIKIRLWISHTYLIPVRVKATNLTQNKIQTEEITNISFNENDYKVILKEFEKIPHAKLKTKFNWSAWQKEREQKYRKVLQIDQQENLTPKQKIAAWEGFLKTLSKDNPKSGRDNKMRFDSHSRIEYWQFVNRFHLSKAGIVKDSQTGLEWIAGPDKDTSWEEARLWVSDLKVDGGGWRLPTIDELKTLYKNNRGEPNLPPYLKTAGRFGFVWSGERRNKPGSWCLEFAYGQKTAYGINYSKDFRAFAVRGVK